MSGDELALVEEAFAGNYIAPVGPMLDAFEQEFAAYVGIPHCVALSSGTAAMHLALRHLGIGPGDAVLASTLTFAGSVTPILFERAEPVFIDCDRETWNMDPALLAEELADRAKNGAPAKAVVPTDLYGQCCNLPAIRKICDAYNVPVICDSAEAVGAKYRDGEDGLWRHSGWGAQAAVYSFNGNKIITTSSGGMLASADKALIAHARKLAAQAREPVPHYEHAELGYNYRLSNVLAAIGRAQLRVIEQRVERKREIFAEYRQRLCDLPGLAFMPEPPFVRGNRWLTVLLLEPKQFGADAATLLAAFEAAKIEARPMWQPMHLQPLFAGCRLHSAHDVAVSESLFRHGLCLPSGTQLTDQDMDRICAVVRQRGRATE